MRDDDSNRRTRDFHVQLLDRYSRIQDFTPRLEGSRVSERTPI